jgi:hypothetical protein
MPNGVESICPICKQPAKPAPTREKTPKGGVSVQMNLVCVDCKLFWTPDLGWKPIPKSLRSAIVHRVSEELT